MVLVDGNVVEGFGKMITTSTVNEVFLCHVKVVHVLTPITSCDVVIAEAFHDYVIGNKAFYDLITGDERGEPRHAVDVSLGTILSHMTWKFGVGIYRSQVFISSEEVSNSDRREDLVDLVGTKKENIRQNLLIIHTKGSIFEAGTTNYGYSTDTC